MADLRGKSVRRFEGSVVRLFSMGVEPPNARTTELPNVFEEIV